MNDLNRNNLFYDMYFMISCEWQLLLVAIGNLKK